MGSPELTGLRILVTRPAEQAEPLCQRIEQLGGHCRRLPLLAILPAQDSHRASAPFCDLSRYAWIIFISANAVTQGWPYLQKAGGIPPGCRVITIGKATAEALQRLGGKVDLMPATDFSSDGVLALAPMQNVTGQHFLIIRGEGGKETLATTLRARGAEVVYAEVYRRETPPLDFAQLGGSAGKPAIDLITISSSEALQHLAQQARQQQHMWIFDLPLIVVHPRQVKMARQLGFTLTPQVADNASDAAVIAALVHFRETRRD